MKRISALFILILGIFLLSPSHASASTADSAYFGIDGQEANDPSRLSTLGIKNIYTWENGAGGSQNIAGYTTLNTIRLGSYWWSYDSVTGRGQNFFASNGNPGCMKSFTVDSNTYQYNECTIIDKVNSIYSSISSQSSKYIVIGNEPNMSNSTDSDGQVPSGVNQVKYIARQYSEIYYVIKTLHPDVQVVGPSIIGFNLENGHSWLDSFKAQYVAYYSINPPMDVMNYHAYDTKVVVTGSTWQRRLDASAVATDLNEFISWVNTNYAGKSTFITEFGVLNCASPCVNNNESSLKTYLNSLINTFRQNRVSYRLNAWMLFSYPGVNPVALFSSGTTLTNLGIFYQKKIAQIFDDVGPLDPAFDQIQAIALAGITQGSTGSGPLGKDYKPSDLVPRDQMAAFLTRAAGLSPVTSGQYFCDVSSSTPFYGEIQAIYVAGISLGSTDSCSPQLRKYNPGQIVPRDQMAAFIRRAKGLTPATSGQAFCDVNSTTPFYGDIQALSNAGIVQGSLDSCTPQGRKYFPSNLVPRLDMAIYLYNAFIPH